MSSATLPPMKIMHVDDHQLFAEGLKAVLEHSSNGHTVLSASDANSALDLASSNPDLDLIMVDLGLPGIDGHALIKALFERNIIVPVIVMSGVDDLWQIKQCMDEGAMGFIPKSVETDNILNAIETVIRGDTYLPEELCEKINNLPSDTPSDQIERIAASLKISKRQMEVLRLMREGYGNQDIANILCVSEHTVKSHARVLFQTFGAANRVECVRSAEKAGLLI